MRKNTEQDTCLRSGHMLKTVITFTEPDGLASLFWNLFSFSLNDKCSGFSLGSSAMRIFFLNKKIKEQLEIDLPFVIPFAVSWKGLRCAEIGFFFFRL